MSQGSTAQTEQPASQDDINWSPYLIDGALREDAISGLTPDTRANVARLMQAADSELGPGLQIYSAYRSPELQGQLYDKAVAKYGSPEAARKWVAPPGRSKHNSGQAVDLKFKGTRLDQADPTIAAWVKTNAPKYGLNVPMEWEPWQVELAGARDGALPSSQGGPPQAGMGNPLGVDPRLLAIYGNDFATPQQKMIMELMVQKQMRENEPAPKLTPMQELQLERARYLLCVLNDCLATTIKTGKLRLSKAKCQIKSELFHINGGDHVLFRRHVLWLASHFGKVDCQNANGWLDKVNAGALREILFACLSSPFSFFFHPFKVCAAQPILTETETIAAQGLSS